VFAAEATALGQRIAQIPNTAANRALREHDQKNLAQLQTLSIVGAPVRIAQQADIPTSRGSRKTGFYGLLGAVLGLLVGLAAAFLRESLDRTVHDPRQVDAHLGLPIVGHVSDDALGERHLASQEVDSASRRTALAQFGLLRRNVELLDESASPLQLLVSSPGQDGNQAIIAAALSYSFARIGRRTLLIEADMRRPKLAARLALKPEPGVSDYLGGDLELADVVQPVEAGPESAGPGVNRPSFSCIPAGTAVANPDERLASGRLRDLLREAAANFGVVIVCAPPLLSVPDALEVLPLVDACVVCVRAGRTTLSQLDATRGLLSRASAGPAGVVVTGVAKHTYRSGDQLATSEYGAVA
jgi:Mrp family chromosome partitioning ATPase